MSRPETQKSNRHFISPRLVFHKKRVNWMFPFPLHKSSESKQRKKNWRLGARNRRKTFLVLRQNEMRVVSWPMFFCIDNLRLDFGVAHWIDLKINLRRLKNNRSFKIVKIHFLFMNLDENASDVTVWYYYFPSFWNICLKYV